jgi:tetratricopeptide (TPR) repeat protein
VSPDLAALQAEAEAALARGDHQAAQEALGKALEELGQGYFDPKLVDDSGLHVRLAQLLQEQGRLPEATALRKRALAERLAFASGQAQQT